MFNVTTTTSDAKKGSRFIRKEKAQGRAKGKRKEGK